MRLRFNAKGILYYNNLTDYNHYRIETGLMCQDDISYLIYTEFTGYTNTGEECNHYYPDYIVTGGTYLISYPTGGTCSVIGDAVIGFAPIGGGSDVCSSVLQRYFDIQNGKGPFDKPPNYG